MKQVSDVEDGGDDDDDDQAGEDDDEQQTTSVGDGEEVNLGGVEKGEGMLAAQDHMLADASNKVLAVSNYY